MNSHSKKLKSNPEKNHQFVSLIADALASPQVDHFFDASLTSIPIRSDGELFLKESIIFDGFFLLKPTYSVLKDYF